MRAAKAYTHFDGEIKPPRRALVGDPRTRLAEVVRHVSAVLSFMYGHRVRAVGRDPRAYRLEPTPLGASFAIGAPDGERPVVQSAAIAYEDDDLHFLLEASLYRE